MKKSREKNKQYLDEKIR